MRFAFVAAAMALCACGEAGTDEPTQPTDTASAQDSSEMGDEDQVAPVAPVVGRFESPDTADENINKSRTGVEYGTEFDVYDEEIKSVFSPTRAAEIAAGRAAGEVER